MPVHLFYLFLCDCLFLQRYINSDTCDQITVRFYSFFSQLLPSEEARYERSLVMHWSMSPTEYSFEGGQMSSTGLSATKAHLFGGMGQWIIIRTFAVCAQTEPLQRTGLNYSCSQHCQTSQSCYLSSSTTTLAEVTSFLLSSHIAKEI